MDGPLIQLQLTPAEYALLTERVAAGQIAANGTATILLAQAGIVLLSDEQLAAIDAVSGQPPAVFVAEALDTQIRVCCALGR